MSVLAVTNPTLLDLKSRMNPDGSIAAIIEILDQKNEMIQDIPMLECNDGSTHVATLRTGIPQPTWRKAYGGIQPSKSTTTQVTFGTGEMGQYIEIDKSLADRNGNSAAFMLSEALPHIEGLNQEFMSTFFYGNEKIAPQEFTGLSEFYNDLSAENGDHILDASGNANTNTSVWLLVLGPNSIHGLYPRGMQGGIRKEDKGQVTVDSAPDGNGRYEAYRSHLTWNVGLAVPNWTYGVRIANIDPGDLTRDAETGPDLIDLMSQALEIVQDLGSGRPVFACNRTIRSFLRRQIVNKVAQSTLTMDSVAGKKVMFFDDVPVRRCDALLNTEDNVS